MTSTTTTKLITIERFFSSGFSRDFRTEISCFVPILCKIPVEWMNQNHKKATKTATMTGCRRHNSVDRSAASSKKLQKKQHFHTTISLKSITMAFFLTCRQRMVCHQEPIRRRVWHGQMGVLTPKFYENSLPEVQ